MAPTKNLVAFDLRGIFVTPGNFEFGNAGRKIAFGENLPLVQSPDGYTMLFNPYDFPSGGVTNPLFAYYPGKFASPVGQNGSQVATLNPFIAFGKNLPRRAFGYQDDPWLDDGIKIQAPLTDTELKFGYAIDASWMQVDAVNDPLVDFPLEANCLRHTKLLITFRNRCLHFPAVRPQSRSQSETIRVPTRSTLSQWKPRIFSSAEIFNSQQCI